MWRLQRFRVVGSLPVLIWLLVQSFCVNYAGGKDLDPSYFRNIDDKRRGRIPTKKEAVWRGEDGQLWKYHGTLELAERLRGLEKRCKKIIKVEKIGKSTLQKTINAIRVSKAVGKGGVLPKVKIIGNVHGDEPTGRVFTVALAEWLCDMMEKDSKASDVLSKVDLWLIPTMNPDGFEKKQRENSKGVDLNRDFPDRFSSKSMERSGKEQIETQLMMDWILEKGPFVSSLAIHEGALVANYPWDGTEDKSTKYQACPDDSTFRYLATKYATTHRKMSLASNKEFPNGGITNGAAWYPIYGSMQDWNYVVANCMELTLEVSENKWPHESLLSSMFEDNRKAMIDFILRSAHGGFTGVVYGIQSSRKIKENIPIAATIRIGASELNTTSDRKTGRFHRPLAPGRYSAEISAVNFKPKLLQIELPEDGTGIFLPIHLNSDVGKATTGVAIHKLDPLLEYQSGMVLFACGGITLALLWFIHSVLTYRYRKDGSLMNIIRK